MNTSTTSFSKRLSRAALMAAATLALAAPAQKPAAKPADQRIVATLTRASFNDLTRAATTLGAMIDQPLLPTMAVGAAQQKLLSDFGTMRNDAPVTWVVFMDVNALKKAPLDKSNPLKGIDGGYAVLYPIADDEAAFMRRHGGSEKLPDGTIRLLPGSGRPDESFVKYTADGKYCAFSDKPELARRTAAECARPAALAPAAIASVTLNEQGVDALAGWMALFNDGFKDGFLNGFDRAQANGAKAGGTNGTNGVCLGRDAAEGLAANMVKLRQQPIEKLKMCGGLTMDLVLDEKGLAILGKSSLRKGTKSPSPAGTHLPEKAFELASPGALFSSARNMLASMTNEEMAETYGLAREMFKSVREEIKRNDDKDFAKYKQSIDDLFSAIDDVYATLASVRYGTADWNGGAFSFDAQKRIVISSDSAAAPEQAKAIHAALCRLFDRIAAIFERQWPGSGVCRKAGEGEYVFDISRLMDLVAKEATAANGAKSGMSKKDQEDLAEVKRNVANVLGGATSAIRLKLGLGAEGVSALLATDGASAPAAASGQGAGRLFAAVPEAKRDAVTGFFHARPYTFVRDELMRIMMKCAKGDEAQMLQTIAAAMPPSKPDAALAAAMWRVDDGSTHFAMRLTADEIKCIGAATTAIMAAQNAAPAGAPAAASGADDDD